MRLTSSVTFELLAHLLLKKDAQDDQRVSHVSVPPPPPWLSYHLPGNATDWTQQSRAVLPRPDILTSETLVSLREPLAPHSYFLVTHLLGWENTFNAQEQAY